MNPDQFRQVEEIYQSAMDRETSERDAYLE